MSLRLRLVLGPIAVMIAAIVVALALLIHQARLRITAERISSIALTETLVTEALAHLTAQPSPSPIATLAQLAARLPAPHLILHAVHHGREPNLH